MSEFERDFVKYMSMMTKAEQRAFLEKARTLAAAD